MNEAHAGSHRQYSIIAFRDGEPDRRGTVNGSRFIIGRSHRADLHIPDATVSREHAAIYSQGSGQLTIEDCGSTNGIFVNGTQVTSAPLNEGDLVSVGAYTVVVRAMEADEPSASETMIAKGKTRLYTSDASKRLYDAFQIKHSPEHYEALYKIALLLGETADLKMLLHDVLAIILQALPAQRGTLSIRHGSGYQDTVQEILALDEHTAFPPLDDSLIDLVARAKNGFILEDAGRQTGAARLGAEAERWPIVCVPLCGAKGNVGALFLDGALPQRPFSNRALEFATAAGRVIAMIVENKDLSEMVVRQEPLATLGRGIAGISHDVRNVIVGMKVGVEQLCGDNGTDTNGKADRAKRLVQKSAQQVEAYLTELLNYVRHNKLVRRPSFLCGLIEDAIDMVQPLAQQHNVTIEFGGGVYEPAYIDPDQIQRVVLNLLKNAVEACAGRGGTVSVAVGSHSGMIVIQVSDTGAGIAQHDLAHLAEPFFTRKGSAGTGLGLAISYRIVEQHGGHIDVASELGKGTVFNITLPDADMARVRYNPPEQCRVAVGVGYARCPQCSAVWDSMDAMLCDESLALAGYHAPLKDPAAALVLFHHGCSATLSLPVSDLLRLHQKLPAPTTADQKTFTVCLLNSPATCSSQCHCTEVRELIQVLRARPRAVDPAPVAT